MAGTRIKLMAYGTPFIQYTPFVSVSDASESDSVLVRLLGINVIMHMK